MSKQNKSNSGSNLNAGELGSEIPAANFPVETPPANVDTETGEILDNAGSVTNIVRKKKMKTLISGAEFWRFEPEHGKTEFDGDVFEGYYRGNQIREKDGLKEDQKAGSIIGYIFEQAETGEHYIIGKGHSVEKALKAAEFNKEKMMRFVYLGKGTTAAGQPFNRFEIAIEE